jgi:DNA-binding response OmpR family regulator
MIKILVVDDDPIIGEMLEFMLGSKGYSAVISNKPEQTVHNILNNGIDLIMLDQFIFGASGIEVCKELQENENTAHVPILMMSAHSEVKKKCLAAGATDFISKPFEMKAFFSKIETILKQTEV